MKIYLQKAIFINRAPFDKLELDFNENEIAVLSAVNGKGKTTILSHIVDAIYEMARPHFENFEQTRNKYYRISSTLYNLKQNEPSFVYLRFKTVEGIIDYIDIREKCTEEQYNEAINIDNKIPFSVFRSELQTGSTTKKIFPELNRDKAKNFFFKNILTYFPSYRYEMPGYLNEPYQIELNFKKKSDYAGYLKNPIEVITELPELANWIMDLVLDGQYGQVSRLTKAFIDVVMNLTLVSKGYTKVRFGIGLRNSGSSRLQIVTDIPTLSTIYPSIFNLSSGEASLLCLFGEILRQADNYKSDILLNDISGIVLIDEIDKHLHIKLQKEILPQLFSLFPNVQFIVSSHSPFLSMGLAEIAKDRSKIIDLDTYGISKDPTTNDLYKEVYEMMVHENERFKTQYSLLKEKISQGTKPIVVTEGKTDIKHIKKAIENLNIEDCDVDFFEIPDKGWGYSELKTLLENLSKVHQAQKIIGVFDRDEKTILDDIENSGQPYKDYGNNVYAFCIPIPASRRNYTNISIEFYYSDSELKKEKNGKRLYFDNEIEFKQKASDKKNRKLVKLETVNSSDEFSKKIFDENIGEFDWIHSKSVFADLVENDIDFISDFDFRKFQSLIDKIKEIITLPETAHIISE